MNIVVIEDEKPTARDLAKTIAECEPGAEIIAILPTVKEAIEFLETHENIDLIFSDIQLSDGVSFSIFEAVDCHIPVIFCTAYNEYALEAFKTTGIDYLVKPFTKASVGKALQKYRQLKEHLASPHMDVAALMNTLKQRLTPTKIPSVIIHQGDKIIPLDGSVIALFYIDKDAVFAYTFDQKKHMLTHTLDQLEKIFSPTFFRANRQILINRKAVKDASHFFNRKLVVNLMVPFHEQILVGKLKVTAFIEWLSHS